MVNDSQAVLSTEEKGQPQPTMATPSTGADVALSALQKVEAGSASHPIHWNPVKKWAIIAVYCLLQTFIALSTTTYVSAEFLVQEKYGGSTQVVALGQSMFIVGTAVGPAFLGPLSYVIPDVAGFSSLMICQS